MISALNVVHTPTHRVSAIYKSQTFESNPPILNNPFSLTYRVPLANRQNQYIASSSEEPAHAAQAAIAPAPLAPVQARSAARFIDSVGVNTHLTYTDTEYGDTNLVTAELKRLGVKHVRDGFGIYKLPATLAMGASGIKFGLNVGTPPYSSTAFQTAISSTTTSGLRYIEAWEGANELDANDPNWVKDWNPDFAALVTANTQAMALWGSPLAFAGHASQLTPAQANYGTFHPYPGGQNPSILYPSQVNLIQPLFPGSSLIASETGYHNALNDHKDQPAIDYVTGGKYLPRLLLESFNAGVYRTYIYELFDEESTWNNALQDTGNSNEQCHWGLVDANGVEKPGFTAIRNLLAVLKNGDAETGSPTSLAYTLTGGQNVHQLLLQKAPGVFDLILWQDVSSWNQTAQTEIVNAPLAVTLVVSAASITTSRPSVSITKTAQTRAANGVTLSVPDDPLVVEINVGP